MDEPNAEPVPVQALADVTPPHAVRRAVRRYRKRIVIAVAAILLTPIVALGFFLWFVVRPVHDTRARIRNAAASTINIQDVKNVDGYQVVVLETAELRPAYGVHFVVVSPVGEPPAFRITPKGVRYENNIFADAPSISSATVGSRASEYWLIVEPDGRRVVPFVLSALDSANDTTREHPVGEFWLTRFPQGASREYDEGRSSGF